MRKEAKRKTEEAATVTNAKRVRTSRPLAEPEYIKEQRNLDMTGISRISRRNLKKNEADSTWAHLRRQSQNGPLGQRLAQFRRLLRLPGQLSHPHNRLPLLFFSATHSSSSSC
ncbi:hypothetical protein ACLB2K_061380 [Fragaria x ananassa]